MPLQFRILGPLEVWDDRREVELGAGRQRALLALLLLHAGEPVSAERLADELWEGRPPASAQKIVQGYVSQLRRALPDGTIVTRGSAYALIAVTTDARAFEEAVARADGEDPASAVRTLRTALALWRGRPLGEFEYETWAQAEAARLEELRVVAVEDRVEAELSLGEGARLVPELETLAAQHPFRERLHAQLMLARYRSGGQAAALETYAALRRRLVDELGIEPGPELQALQRRVLEQDPALAGARRPRPLATRNRARALVAVGVVLVAAAAAAAAVALTRGGNASGVPGDALALVSPAGAKPATEAVFAGAQTSIAAGGGVVWTLDGSAGTITILDEPANRVLDTFSPGARPVDVAYGAGSFWVLTAGYQPAPGQKGHAIQPAVTRFDPRAHVPTESIPLRAPAGVGFFYLKHRPGQHQLAFGAHSLWVVNASSIDSSIYRIDPRTAPARITGRVTTVDAGTIVFAGGRLWSENLDTIPTEIDEIDPETLHVVRRIRTPATGPSSFAVGAGAIWVADFHTGTVWRVLPGPPQVVRAVLTGVGTTSVAVGAGAVWAGNEVDDTLARIDPRRAIVTRTIPVPAPQALALTANGALVASGPTATGDTLPGPACGPLQYPGHGTPRLLIASDFDFRGDPAVNDALASGVLAVLRRSGFRAGRYTVGYQSCDDSSGVAGVFDPGTCSANARLYAETRKVVGVVGTYDSGCAGEELPILEAAKRGPVALVSPSNTYDFLTRTIAGEPADLLAHLYPNGVRNYFRVIVPDATAVAADATFLKELGVHRVAVGDTADGGATPSHVAEFRYAAQRLGLATAVVHWSGLLTAAAAAARVRAVHADAVFIPKYPPFPPPMFPAFRRALGPMPIVGTDYLPPTRGAYVGYAGAPNEQLPPAGRRFLAALKTRTPELSAAYGAEAATVLLDAIARSDGTRSGVVRELHRTNVRGGMLGDLRFTPAGDPVTGPVTILRGVAHGGLADPPYRGGAVVRIISPAPSTIHP